MKTENRILQILLPTATVGYILALGTMIAADAAMYLGEDPARDGALLRFLVFLVVLLAGAGVASYLTRANMAGFVCAVAVLACNGVALQMIFGDTGHINHMLLGLSCGVIVFAVWRRMNGLGDRLFYVLAAVIALLMVDNILFGIEVNGARLWVDHGIRFQPGEVVRVALMLLGACTYSDPKRIAVYCGLSLFACTCLLLLKDLGGAVMIFAMFLLMTYLLLDEKRLSVGIMLCAAAVFILAVQMSSHASYRMELWLADVMEHEGTHQMRGYLLAALCAGVTGTGFGYSSLLLNTTYAHNDGALIGVAIAYGIPMLVCTMLAYAVLVAQAHNRCLHPAGHLILAQGAMMIFVSAMLNLLGSVDVLPFTGITAPLISSGGTSILCSCVVLGLMAASLHPILK